ncbi:MAG: SDR family oxidoreductase [Pseudomonadota bacterium]
MTLENKTVIVTGAAKGIGYAAARRCVEDGAKVVVADIDEDAGHAAEEDLRKLGEATFVHGDVSERLDVRNIMAATIDAYGEIDALVNNAGIVHGADFLELEEADFDRVLKVNLKGMFLCGQAIARHMVDRVKDEGPAGAIVNMSSVNAVFAIPNQVPYTISKGGVNQLTKVMALSLAEYGIRVNAIGPGSIATDLLKAAVSDPDARDRILSRTPMRRVGEPKEIAGVVAFLLSDDAAYITGQTIYADGGRLPLNYTVPVDGAD